MSGYQTVLGRDWFVATENYYRQQSLSYPNSIDYKIEATIAKHRLLAVDLALLFAQLPRGAITVENFERESDKFAGQISTWKEKLDPVFRDPSYLVQSFEGRKRAPEDIVDPYLPGGLYRGALFTFNFMLIDWHAINLMHGYKTASMLKRPLPLELSKIALDICRLFEAIEYWPDSPPGSLLKAQGSLGLAILVLPKDEKHIMWCRRKLAKVESLGYVPLRYIQYCPQRGGTLERELTLQIAIYTHLHFATRWLNCGVYPRLMNGGYRTKERVPLWFV